MKSKSSLIVASLLGTSLSLGACSIPNRSNYEINEGYNNSTTYTPVQRNQIQSSLEQRVLAPAVSPIPEDRPNIQEFCGYSITELGELIPQGFSRVSILDNIPYSELTEYESLHMFKEGTMPPIELLSLNSGEDVYFGAGYLDPLGRGDNINVYALNGNNQLVGFQVKDFIIGFEPYRDAEIFKVNLDEISTNPLSTPYICGLINDIVRFNTSQNDSDTPPISFRDILQSKES